MDARNTGGLWAKLDQRLSMAVLENIMDGAKPPSDFTDEASDVQHSRQASLNLGIRKHLEEELSASQVKLESLQMTEPIDPADVLPLSGALCPDIQMTELRGNQSTPHYRQLKDSVSAEGTLEPTEARPTKNAKMSSKKQRQKMKKVLASTIGEVEPRENVTAARGTESTKISTRDRKPTASMERRANSSQIPTHDRESAKKQRNQSCQDPMPDREQMRKELQKAFKEAEKKWRRSSEFKTKFQFHDNMFMMFYLVQGMSRWLLHQLGVLSEGKCPMGSGRQESDREEQVKEITDACEMILHEATKVFGNFSLERMSELIEAELELSRLSQISRVFNGRLYVPLHQLQGAHEGGIDARMQSPKCSFRLYTRLLYWKARMQLDKIVDSLPSYNKDMAVKAELDKIRHEWSSDSESDSEASLEEETGDVEEEMTPEKRKLQGNKATATPSPGQGQVCSTSGRGSTPLEESLRSESECSTETLTEALGLNLYDYVVFWMSFSSQLQSTMLLARLSEEEA